MARLGKERRRSLCPTFCSSESKSEIVVPVFANDGKVMAVLDIDSQYLATFDDIDRKYLEDICKLIS